MEIITIITAAASLLAAIISLIGAITTVKTIGRDMSDKEQNILYWLMLYSPRSESELDKLTGRKTKASLKKLMWMRYITWRKGGYCIRKTAKGFAQDKIINDCVKAIKNRELSALNHYLIYEAYGLDHIREQQKEELLMPILDGLKKEGLDPNIVLKKMLKDAQSNPEGLYDFAITNIVNLLIYNKADLNGMDFSNLNIGQVNFEDVSLKDVDFSGAILEKTRFLEPMITAKCCLLHPDGKHFITGGNDGKIVFWNLETRQKENQFLSAHNGTIWKMAAFTDNHERKTQYYMASCGADGKCLIWNITDISSPDPILVEMKTNAGLNCLDWNQEKNLLAVAGDKGIIYYCSFIRDQEPHWKEYTDGQGVISYYSLRFSPNGRFLTAGINDKVPYIFSVQEDGLELRRENIYKSAIEEYHQRKFIHPCIRAIAFLDSTGKRFVTGGAYGNIAEWRRCVDGKWKRVKRFSDITLDKRKVPFVHGGKMVTGIVLVGDGRKKSLFSVGADGKICKWTLHGRKKTYESKQGSESSLGHIGAINEISSGGQTLLTCGEDNTIRIWDISTGQLSYIQGRNASINRMTLYRGRYLFLGCADSLLRCWDLTDNKFLQYLNQWGGAKKEVDSLVISPEADLLAAGMRDGTFFVWDFRTEREVAISESHNGSVRSITILRTSENIFHMFSASPDGTIKKYCLKRTNTGTKLDNVQEFCTGFPGWLGFICSYEDTEGLLTHGSLAHLMRKPLPIYHNSVNGPDLLAYIQDGVIKVGIFYNGAIVEIIQKFHMLNLKMRGDIQHMAFSKNGKWFAVADGDGKLYLWDMQDTQHKRDRWSFVINASESYIGFIDFSPNSNLLAMIVGADQCVRILPLAKLNSKNIKERALLIKSDQFFPTNTHTLTSVLFQSDDSIIISGSSGEIAVLTVDPQTGTVYTDNGHAVRFPSQYAGMTLENAKLSKLRKETLESMSNFWESHCTKLLI